MDNKIPAPAELFCPVLVGSKISRNYLNPGDTLFVTLTFINNGQHTAPARYRFAMDILYGHQRKLENKQFNYRVTTGAFPDVTKWNPGMETDVTLRWEVTSQWSGTYHLVVKILDDDDIPVPFFVPDVGMVTQFNIGCINTSWNLGRPWVAENTHPICAEYVFERSATAKDDFLFNQEHTITLSDNVDIILACDAPRILSINNIRFKYAMPEINLKHLYSNRYFIEPAQFILVKQTNTEAVYNGVVCCGGVSAASFKLSLSLSGQTLSVAVDNITETEGYELLSVKYPVLAEIGSGYLLDFFGGGRLIPIEEATPIFFERPYDVRNAAVLHNNKHMFIVESKHIDSMLITGVYRTGNEKRGFIGGVITCRIPAEGNRHGIAIKTPPVFSIELCDTDTPDWTVAARLLRRGVKPNNARDLYRNAYVYKQLTTWGPLPDESYRYADIHPLTQNLFKTVTFANVEDNVRKFSNLTDNTKQVMYVTGFQKGGFDDAYPYPYDTEARCGNLKDLSKCLEEMRKYNAITGLHDNFDDISVMHVKNFPYVAMDSRGEPWHGWVWAAGPTYMTSLCSLVESGALAERVKTMVNILPLKDSYHIDVLTAETCRYDFNPQCPASAEDSFNAKMKVVAEWNKYSIDITSEMLSHPSVGHIGFALHTRMDVNEVFIPGDSFIPLVHMIYHGIIGYAAPSGNRIEILWGLLIGGQVFYEEDIAGPLCISRFYIQNIPAMKLYDKTMTGYIKEGSCARADYDEGSYVCVDFELGTYRVVVDDILIGQGFTTFVPANSTPEAYLAYAFEDTQVSYQKPDVFKGGELYTVTLTAEGHGEILENAVRLEGDSIILNLPPMTPVMIREVIK